MKKRIALAAVAALAGGILVAAPASATTWDIVNTVNSSYQVGSESCFGTSADATFSISPSATLVSHDLQNVCYTFLSSGATTITADWASVGKPSTSLSFNVQPADAPNPDLIGAITGPATQIAGEANTADLLVQAPNGSNAYITITGASTAIEGTPAGASAVGTNSFKLGQGVGTTVTVKTPVVGTITAKMYLETAPGVFSTTASVTFTMSVTVAPAPAAYNHTVVSAIDTDYADVSTYSTSAGVFAYKGSAVNSWLDQVGRVDVQQYESADTSTVATDATDKSVVVTLTGPGLLDVYDAAASHWISSGTYVAVTSSHIWFDVYGDGRTGVSTITVSVNGVVVKTLTVTFFGDVAKYTTSLNHKQVQYGHADEAIVTVSQVDANGIAVPFAFAEPTVTNADTVTVTEQGHDVAAFGTETYTVNSAVKGAQKIQFANGVDTQTVTVNFVTPGVETVTVTSDKATYAPGEQATFTINAVNADGVVVGDDEYSVAASASASVIGLTTSDLTFTDGVATFKGYMPLAQGPVKVTAHVGSDEHAVNSVSVTVVDAAAVANAAAITALQTSVATLTTTVASLVASMTAQIKVINATMLKIQKAVAALRLQVKKLKK